jgi:GNAT superfamily N-acetyltransferase
MRTAIRPAVVADSAEIARLVSQYWDFESIDGFDPVRIEGLLRDALAAPDRAACWVAANNGRIVGYLLIVFVLSLEYGGLMAEVDEFFVEPDARGCGIGVAMLRSAEEALRRLGVERLQLQLGVENQGAREFYSRCGFARRLGFDLWEKPLSSV